ncbi:putative SprT protein [Marinomonas sp. MED121]|uniref:SprT family zinc-dependent metalloprotease n=1 Tax=Marinomonas sp. MED121 TaxID=314277 RepID=UPI0000690B9B|nr:SprT family zinc-dependent metalloprotease [Marinomonas sp. MED121]EAQ65893.1 putative SprT protein [Marinomonas sp. MED121]
MEDFASAIKEKVNACTLMANRYFKSSIKPPKIALNQRGSAAGTAYLQRHEVRFNQAMYEQDPQGFIRTVVPHEVAHIFVYQHYGKGVKPHGKEWKFVMEYVFGVKAERTHNFDVVRSGKEFLYLCDCSEHSLTIRRHNKVLKGMKYQCRNCLSVLKQK